ncbi:helix-turn-helix transcriptional regulator [Streptomyces tsukubensis]|uniref:helix-turn-helix transcriptional regulator n=1 Tax=Streptomyces tsukubensis TaxID=83656 RepID=UPI00368C1EE6
MLGGVETRYVSPVFVGRAGEFSLLTGALSRAAGEGGGPPGGDPQALLVGGEAGVGKTRLVEELWGEACRRGAAVAVGGCIEIGADGLPFAPFSAALRSLRRLMPEEMAAAAAGHEQELARLLPELGGAPRGEGGRHGDEELARLFELTTRLLERISAERTVVLVLEDLHWADASTRHLITYLTRTLRRGRLLFLVTYRSDDIHRRHPLRPFLAELERTRTVQRIELTRFNRAEVRRQLIGILAAEPEPTMVDSIFERSDGNAFFVEELARSLAQGSPCGLPDSLRDILLVRVEALPERAQRVVRILAEGGSTVEYGLLLAVAGLPEDDLIEALRAGVEARILQPTADGTGYRFRHSLAREAVSDDLLPPERSRLNRAYAQALEADPALVPDEERAMRLAGYWYHAHDAAKALPAVLGAAVEARRRHAYSEQLWLLERAMELWDTVPDGIRDELRPMDYAEAYPPCGCDPESKPLRFLDLIAEATVAGTLSRDRERALKIARRGQRLALGEGDPLRAAWFCIQRAKLVSVLGRGDGHPELTEAQELVRGLPPSVVHAQVLTAVAHWCRAHAPGHDGLATAERAVEYARMVGDEETELSARLSLGGFLADAGHIEEGLAEMYAVKDRALELGLPHLIAGSHANLPHTLESVGRSQAAVALLKEGLEVASRHGLLGTEAWVLVNLAESYYTLGRWDEARTAAERALEVGNGPKPRGWAAFVLALLELGRGDIASASRWIQEARSHFGTEGPTPQSGLGIDTVTIGVAAAEARIADARALFSAVPAQGFAPGSYRYAWPLLRAVATMEADARGLPAAEEGREESLDRIDALARGLAATVPLWMGHERWVRAEARRARGEDTPEDWEEAGTAFEEAGFPYGLAMVRHRWAEALLPADRDRAAQLLRAAAHTAAELGARPLTEDIALLAQRARIGLSPEQSTGSPGADPAPGPLLGLTPREEDVLRLVAAGRSNRQIAEALYISPKTASVHVSNILGKLGVSGRGEAAAVAHRLRLFPPETEPEPVPAVG